MSMNSILNVLRNDGEEFITSNTIRSHSNKLSYHVGNVMKYLTSQGQILEVLNDMFYVKDIDEIKKRKLKYSQYELVSKALAYKKVEKWYFGLHTALKFDLNEKNDVFFDSNTDICYIINERLTVNKPVTINGDKFSFLVFNDELLNFGIKNNGKYRYSNLEKTILDYIYLYNSNQVREGKIIFQVSKYKNSVSIERILRYSKHYPTDVAVILEKANFRGN